MSIPLPQFDKARLPDCKGAKTISGTRMYYFKVLDMRLLVALCLIFTTSFVRAEQFNKQQMVELVSEASDMLLETGTVMKFQTAEELAGFKTSKLIPLNHRVHGLGKVSFELEELQHCRFYLQMVLAWYDLVLNFKTGGMTKANYTNERELARSNIDMWWGNCNSVLNEDAA